MNPVPPPYVAVAGPGQAADDERQAAEEIGRHLARAGVVVLTGGLGGVMAAACRGAAGEGGTSVALLPGSDRAAANPWATIALPTGLGELRNGLLIRCADVLVAVGGAYGTLSEVALALKAGIPVVGWRTWPIAGVERVESPEAAAERASTLAVG